MNSLDIHMQQVEWLLAHCQCRPCPETIGPAEARRACGRTHHITNKRQHQQLKHPLED